MSAFTNIHVNSVKKIHYGVVKTFTGWGRIKCFRRSNLFLAIYVCRMIFASFHQGKEEIFVFIFLKYGGRNLNESAITKIHLAQSLNFVFQKFLRRTDYPPLRNLIINLYLIIKRVPLDRHEPGVLNHVYHEVPRVPKLRRRARVVDYLLLHDSPVGVAASVT